MTFFASEVANIEAITAATMDCQPYDAAFEAAIVDAVDPLTKIQYLVQRQISTFRQLLSYCTRPAIKAVDMQVFSIENIKENPPQNLKTTDVEFLCEQLIQRRLK
eukprot:gnl/Chilomastix_caulleri/2813.p1 GENE.gnl/Chilomastix_caulleri/2813~~gnl/Chilomastix_caulleri/2813.p1  ORF type:complete len:105 (+),score=16.12 gnl/Chilomastix_caulleri/2813:43-357(+)